MFVVLNIGALGASATVNAQLKAAPTQSGMYTAVQGTQITQISTGASNLVLIELRNESLAGQGLGPWLELVVTIETAACQVSAVVFGTMTYCPASDYNLVTPTQTIVV